MASDDRGYGSSPSKPRDPLVVGLAAFDKISAVEGIFPSKESLMRTADFDRRGLTAEERRREIISAHTPRGKA